MHRATLTALLLLSATPAAAEMTYLEKSWECRQAERLTCLAGRPCEGSTVEPFVLILDARGPIELCEGESCQSGSYEALPDSGKRANPDLLLGLASLEYHPLPALWSGYTSAITIDVAAMALTLSRIAPHSVEIMQVTACTLSTWPN